MLPIDTESHTSKERKQASLYTLPSLECIHSFSSLKYLWHLISGQVNNQAEI